MRYQFPHIWYLSVLIGLGLFTQSAFSADKGTNDGDRSKQLAAAEAPVGATESKTHPSKVRQEPQLTAEETRTALIELRKKNLLMPIQGMDPDTIKGNYYAKRGNDVHHAVDILAPRNTPIHAVEDGKIARLFLSKAGGITIYAYDPTEKYIYYYAHLERYADGLEAGDTIRRGQVIGFVGTSGNAPADCPHLHFSISKPVKDGSWYPSAPIDPYEVFKNTQSQGPPLAPPIPPQPKPARGTWI